MPQKKASDRSNYWQLLSEAEGAEANLRDEALAVGLELRVHRLETEGVVHYHWSFRVHGRKKGPPVLDYWPTSETAYSPSRQLKAKGLTPYAAFALARQLHLGTGPNGPVAPPEGGCGESEVQR